VDDAAYLRAICWAPFDDGPRLVYADHLEELGECARAEFIRVQCELARWPCECDTSEERVYHDECRCKERGELRRRERELWLANWEPWTEGVRSVLRPLSYGPDSCTLPDLSRAQWEFRRGLVAAVTLTAAQFFGGPCGRCGGIGGVFSEESPLTDLCPACSGTGRAKGLAAALFRAAPVTEVRLSDREPDAISDGRLAWWYTDPDWHRPGLYQHHWLPVELRPHLTGRICEPIDEPRPGVCGFDYGDSFEGTDGVGLARADLSAACVAVGRARAELPALARPVSADADMSPRSPVHDVVNHPGGDRE
jgi:uncharacterized protein (TIGR02996 family)